jgi:hypothetical protein
MRLILSAQALAMGSDHGARQSPGGARDDIELACLELITGEVPTRGTQGWLDECTPSR